jgi:hypothetical protein
MQNIIFFIESSNMQFSLNQNYCGGCMFKKSILGASVIIAFIFTLSIPSVVSASSSLQSLDGLTLSEIEALNPMSAEEEAAIVQVVPQVPIIIDGVLYKPEDITLFNGHRLRFTIDDEGNFYAFTTVEGAEKFLVDYLIQSGFEATHVNNSEGTRASVTLCEHITYLGEYFDITGTMDSFGDFNDKGSSFIVGEGIGLGIIWEDEGRTGEYFYRPGGTAIPFLGLYGWNDRASSGQRVG